MEFLNIALKGAAMGAANVVPGVSGGTIAFITGIYERLLNALKSFGPTALRLLLKGDLKGFVAHTDFWFLASLGVGVVVSILTLARVFGWFFDHHPALIWSFFFGLILASIPFVATMANRWGYGQFVALVIGCGAAASLTFLTPASENDNTLYLGLCGAAAMCSMIIPGISGSFVLLLMGNYHLVLRAVNDRDIGTIVPIGVGAVVGLIALSHLLSWLFKRFHDSAVALITGFVIGSLPAIYPWKEAITQTFEVGDEVKEKAIGYEYLVPDFAAPATYLAFGIMVIGAILIVLVERLGGAREGSLESSDL